MINKYHHNSNKNINNILSSILLPNLKLTHLNKFSSLLGGPKIGSTKLAKCQNLNNYLSQLNQFIKPIQILSIDTGLINFAWTSFTLPDTEGQPLLTQWGKLNLYKKFFNDTPIKETKFSPLDTSYLTTQLTRLILNESNASTNTLYTIERQRLRTNSSKFVTDPILNVNILEHLLFYSLNNLNPLMNNNMYRNISVVSSDPGRMTKYWLANQNFNSKQSKRLRIETVMSLLNQSNSKDGLFKVATPLYGKISNLKDYKSKNKTGLLFDLLEMNEEVNGKRKDDDLADSLLHGLSWSIWIQTYQKLLNDIDKDGGEKFKLSEWIDYKWNQHIKVLDSIKENQ